MNNTPGYWISESSGVLRPAIIAYLNDEHLSLSQIVTIRAYLRQWLDDGYWKGAEVAGLRQRIPDLTTKRAIERWLDDAGQLGIDPL